MILFFENVNKVENSKIEDDSQNGDWKSCFISMAMSKQLYKYGVAK